ncbi:MAG: ferredoxin:glutaredoxin reductase [Euryarchaeota archaeon]|nr:ferredoxin:glutaredoxin reductase [Euryarchaeota archaeon]
MNNISKEDVEKLYNKLYKEAEEAGYHLNPDADFAKDLVRSLLVNEKRYGCQACPCRLATGKKSDDIDIICPCDYRDSDLNEYGACFCGLYVSKDIVDGKKELKSIPERRPSKEERVKMKDAEIIPLKLTKPVWRCKVCGYLCGRDEPPEICPICKVKKYRFERFM